MNSEYDYLFDSEYRSLTYESYDYLLRLINNEKCGVMKYDVNNDKYYECFDELITIYF